MVISYSYEVADPSLLREFEYLPSPDHFMYEVNWCVIWNFCLNVSIYHCIICSKITFSKTIYTPPYLFLLRVHMCSKEFIFIRHPRARFQEKAKTFHFTLSTRCILCGDKAVIILGRFWYMHRLWYYEQQKMTPSYGALQHIMKL